ncbi:hypothetical protein GCM10010425_75710 [Streptomyces spororaveus]|uniref:Uncharacterized protein n=1 Tax=Streptomyces spororaveus TaxID=284039 RepID=A0ABQ3T474_9ACTN|nr:hypothetical protein Sspor_05480 [Streptomyces spororaveus]
MIDWRVRQRAVEEHVCLRQVQRRHRLEQLLHACLGAFVEQVPGTRDVAQARDQGEEAGIGQPVLLTVQDTAQLLLELAGRDLLELAGGSCAPPPVAEIKIGLEGFLADHLDQVGAQRFGAVVHVPGPQVVVEPLVVAGEGVGGDFPSEPFDRLATGNGRVGEQRVHCGCQVRPHQFGRRVEEVFTSGDEGGVGTEVAVLVEAGELIGLTSADQLKVLVRRLDQARLELLQGGDVVGCYCVVQRITQADGDALSFVRKQADLADDVCGHGDPGRHQRGAVSGRAVRGNRLVHVAAGGQRPHLVPYVFQGAHAATPPIDEDQKGSGGRGESGRSLVSNCSGHAVGLSGAACGSVIAAPAQGRGFRGGELAAPVLNPGVDGGWLAGSVLLRIG